jgi:hypothetical protein
MSAWSWILVIAFVVVVGAFVLYFSGGGGLEKPPRSLNGALDGSVLTIDLREGVDRRSRQSSLSPEARVRFIERWRMVQSRFVDQPIEAVEEADLLVRELIRERGYPLDSFVSDPNLVSADYPELVTNFRAASEIQLRNRHRRAGPIELRQAVVHYRAMLRDLLQEDLQSQPHSRA